MHTSPIQDLTQHLEPNPLVGLPLPLDELQFGVAVGLRDKRSVRGHIAARRLPEADLVIAGRPRWSRALVEDVLEGRWTPAPDVESPLHALIQVRMDRLRGVSKADPVSAATRADDAPALAPAVRIGGAQ